MAEFGEVQSAVKLDMEPAVVVINQKDGEPYVGPDGEPCTISVLGNEAPQVLAARRKARRAVQRRQFTSTSRADEAEELERAELTAAVVTWEGWTDGGEPWPCTPENVGKMLKVEHIRNQVWIGVYQHAVFFGQESPHSSNSRGGGPGSEN